MISMKVGKPAPKGDGMSLPLILGFFLVILVVAASFGIMGYASPVLDYIDAFWRNSGAMPVDLTDAIRCSHYRCADGCVKVRALGLDNNKCPCERGVQDLDGDGRVCNEEGEAWPVEVKKFDGGLSVSGQDMMIGDLKYACVVDWRSYDNGDLTKVWNIYNWLYIDNGVDSNVETATCYSMSEAVKKASLAENFYVRTVNYCPPGVGNCYFFTTTPLSYYTTRLDAKPTSRYSVISSTSLSDNMGIFSDERSKAWHRFVVMGDDAEIDWIILDEQKSWQSNGNVMPGKFDFVCHRPASPVATSEVILGENRGSLVCGDRFYVLRLGGSNSEKFQIMYLGNTNKITFTPSEVGSGQIITTSALKVSVVEGKKLTLNVGSCSGVQLNSGATCTVGSTKSCDIPQFILTDDEYTRYKGRNILLVLCDGMTYTNFAGTLTVLNIGEKMSCQCNAAKTGCEPADCQGCAKCNPSDYQSPICSNKNFIPFSTNEMFSCCTVADCIDLGPPGGQLSSGKCYMKYNQYYCAWGAPVGCINNRCEYNNDMPCSECGYAYNACGSNGCG
jgi:hypothetical protein